jgi:hypothetical protein
MFKILLWKDSADLPVGIAGNPEALFVAADEKRGDRRVDDAGIKGLKLCCYGRHGKHGAFIDFDCIAPSGRWPMQIHAHDVPARPQECEMDRCRIS